MWADWAERTQEPTREEWLEQACRVLSVDVWAKADAGAISPVRVSVGFPIIGARPSKHMRIGECWYGPSTADGIPQIFVHPTVSDGIAVLAVLLHELIHACLGSVCGHRGRFKQVATALGLEGPMRATVPGDALHTWFESMLLRLGAYPHSKLDPMAGRKVQKTYLLKATCEKCSYTIRLTEKWASLGLPICVCGCNFRLEETK